MGLKRGESMRRLIALATTMALMLVAAAPAFAQDDYVESDYPRGNVFIDNWR